jgi:hypothetical protein
VRAAVRAPLSQETVPRAGTDFTDVSWRVARGWEASLQYPLSPGPAWRFLAGPFSGCALHWTLQRGAGSAFVASIGVFVVTSRGAEYRRRARACLDAAHATRNEATRAALFRLAEDWQRMAEGWDDPARRAAAGHARPVVQQQQQVQPKKK